MAWTVHWRGRTVKAALTAEDRAQVPLAWLVEVLGATIREDKAAAALYIEEPPPLPVLPAGPVGANIDPWLPVRAPVTSEPGRRAAALYELVIKQFQVATNPRYRAGQQGAGETYCNIALWDITMALGCSIPHWVDGRGNPAGPGAPDARETDANAVCRWLQEHGPRYGWSSCTAEEAQAAANAGRPAVATWWAHEPPYIGHVAVVRPGQLDPQRGPAIAQAGGRNFDDGYLVDGFGQRGPVLFYQHE